jgi:Ohr subfamily peroxiredoxin
MKENVMNRLEKVLYTAKAHTTGGRTGMSRSSDGRLEVKLSRPGSPGTGTNPEQLFAAGWSACFDSAMEFAARNMKITLPADHAVDAEIDLGPEGDAFSLAARLYVSLPGMERATAQRLVEVKFTLGTSAAIVKAVPLLLVDLLNEDGVIGRAYAFCYRPGLQVRLPYHRTCRKRSIC